MSERFDAVVIGAGVAGATAAILLAAAGWAVALVEKRKFPRRKVCGECIAATNLGLLDALGVGAAVAELAGPELERVGLYVGEELLTAPLPQYSDPAQAWGRALGREHLDTLLLERAARLGAVVWQPWTVERVVREDRDHVVRLRSAQEAPAELRAPIVVAAHGSWEPELCGVRGRRLPRLDSDLFAFKANFGNAELARGLLPVLAFPGGYGGMVITDHGRLTLACCVRRDRLRAWRVEMPGLGAGKAVQAHLERCCRGVRAALEGAERLDPWLSTGPIRPGLRPAWREQVGFAVGNAAGEAHPILGEGISMALQGAWLLCSRLVEQRDALIKGASQAALAREYVRDWRRSFAARVRWAALFSQLAMRSDSARVLLPALRRWPGFLSLAARLGGKARRADCGAARDVLGSALRGHAAASGVHGGR